MIKATEFRVSRPLYAVDLESYRLSEQGGGYINAVWFRRRRPPGGTDIKTVACAGQLWNYLQPRAQTAAERLSCHTIALLRGFPVARSHASTVSPWLASATASALVRAAASACWSVR